MLRKHWWEFVLRTLIQPFLLCFVFLFVFPKIGQGIGGLGARGTVGLCNRPRARRGRDLGDVPGRSVDRAGDVRGVRLHTRDRGPGPSSLPDLARRHGQGAIGGGAGCALCGHIVLPIAAVVHAAGVHAHLQLHWVEVLTLVPLAAIAMSGLGLVLGTSFEPRNIGLMFGFIILPVTFLGCTYYPWTRLAPVKIGAFHWLQTVVLVNPLVYVNEGMRAAFTDSSHMHLYVIYPVVSRLLSGLPGPGVAKFLPASAFLSSGPS